jgi:(p)ppGpp synthase/HD superfamily hydrolase
MKLDWPADGSQYAVMLKIVSVNRAGLLMDISTIFAEQKANVSAARVRTLPNQTAELDITVDVTDAGQMAGMMSKISQLADVISVLRLFGRTGGK